MTTIACGRKEMAADTRVTWDDPDNKRINTAPAVKIEKVGAEILGSSGDYAAGVRFHEWYREGGKGRKPKLCKDFRAIRLAPDGIYLIDGNDVTWMKIDEEFHAIGSGAPYALGAMRHGASPREAVETAKEFDVHTGGRVTVITL